MAPEDLEVIRTTFTIPFVFYLLFIAINVYVWKEQHQHSSKHLLHSTKERKPRSE